MRNHFPRNSIFLILAAAVFIAAAFGVFKALEERKILVSLVDESYRDLSAAMKSAQSGDRIEAGESIDRSLENIGKLNDNPFFKLISFFKKGASLPYSLEELGRTAALATKIRDDLINELPVIIFTDGTKTRRVVGSLYEATGKIITLSSSFRNQASAISAFSGSDYLAVQSDLEEARAKLAEGVKLLSEDGAALFILIDEREMALSGGQPVAGVIMPFRDGRIIAEEAKAISKDELAEIKGAVSAFNFDAAAKEMIDNLDLEVKLKAVVALNFAAFKKIILLTGLVELPEEGAVLDAQNAREVVMKDKDGDLFAAALSAIVPNLRYLPNDRRTRFSEEARDLLSRRDAQIYFPDLDISISDGGEKFVSGDDYLAVFSSFTEVEKNPPREKIEASVDLYSDGSSDGKVTATRVAPESPKGNIFWHLLLPSGSTVEKVSGGESRQKNGDRTVFPSGLSATGYAAREKVFTAEYRRPAGRAGKYRLIYERQPGTDVALLIKITAPAEYVFTETGRGEYLYESDNPPQRLIINLSTVKLR